MTGRTDAIGVPVRHGEVSMVERGASPVDDGRQMACEASLRETGGNVIGVRGGSVLIGMA